MAQSSTLICFALKEAAAPFHQVAANKPISPEGCRKLAGDNIPGHDREFQWQDGYGAFTVSVSMLETVRHYIANQEEHHRQKTFQEEYVELLKRNGVEYDERYLW